MCFHINLHEYIFQATGGYASSANNSMIPPSTTIDLSNSEGSQMQIRCKFGQLGQGRGQFNAPHGFCLGGRDEDIVVADTHNHRIQVQSAIISVSFDLPRFEVKSSISYNSNLFVLFILSGI